MKNEENESTNKGNTQEIKFKKESVEMFIATQRKKTRLSQQLNIFFLKMKQKRGKEKGAEENKNQTVNYHLNCAQIKHFLQYFQSL